MEVCQYYPSGASQLSNNRLFGMFHAKTPEHSKDVIVQSLQDLKGVVRIVFASMAIGKSTITEWTLLFTIEHFILLKIIFK